MTPSKYDEWACHHIVFYRLPTDEKKISFQQDSGMVEALKLGYVVGRRHYNIVNFLIQEAATQFSTIMKV
jgi:hypothetical protein